MRVSFASSGSDGMKPLSFTSPVAVEEGPEGEPAAVLLGERWREVARIEDTWCFDLWWMPLPLTRAYYRVSQAGRRGRLTLFRDQRQERWFRQAQQRAWPSVSATYVELHAKSFHSFGMGASHVHELLAQAVEYGYGAPALTDPNLCGALEFARLAGSLAIRPISGGEITLTGSSRIVLLAKTREGHANVSRLFTLANATDRREPRLKPAHLPKHADGVILLTGGRDGQLSRLLAEGRRRDACRLLHNYREWYGPDGVYVELQQNFIRGDTPCNRGLATLARESGIPP